MSIAYAQAKTLRLLRFSRVQRTAHWVNATLFFILMFTAIRSISDHSSVSCSRATSLNRFISGRVFRWRCLSLFLSLGRGERRCAKIYGASITGLTTKSVGYDFGKIKPRADKYNRVRNSTQFRRCVDSRDAGYRFDAAVVQVLPVSYRSGATFVHDIFAWSSSSWWSDTLSWPSRTERRFVRSSALGQ